MLLHTSLGTSLCQGSGVQWLIREASEQTELGSNPSPATSSYHHYYVFLGK